MLAENAITVTQQLIPAATQAHTPGAHRLPHPMSRALLARSPAVTACLSSAGTAHGVRERECCQHSSTTEIGRHSEKEAVAGRECRCCFCRQQIRGQGIQWMTVETERERRRDRESEETCETYHCYCCCRGQRSWHTTLPSILCCCSWRISWPTLAQALAISLPSAVDSGIPETATIAGARLPFEVQMLHTLLP